MIRFRRMPSGSGLPIPSRASPGASGFDLRAVATVVLPPGGRVVIGTGFAVEVPPDHEAQVRPRSGMASRDGIVAFLGSVDSDFRGEVAVLLFNHGTDRLVIERGDRIAQLVVSPVSMLPGVEVDTLSDTERSGGGFGSTGVK